MVWTNTSGGSHEGDDWTISALTQIGGDHTNIGIFTISNTVTLDPDNPCSVSCVEFHLEDDVDGEAKGDDGGRSRAGGVRGTAPNGDGGDGTSGDTANGVGGGGCGEGGHYGGAGGASGVNGNGGSGGASAGDGGRGGPDVQVGATSGTSNGADLVQGFGSGGASGGGGGGAHASSNGFVGVAGGNVGDGLRGGGHFYIRAIRLINCGTHTINCDGEDAAAGVGGIGGAGAVGGILDDGGGGGGGGVGVGAPSGGGIVLRSVYVLFASTRLFVEGGDAANGGAGGAGGSAISGTPGDGGNGGGGGGGGGAGRNKVFSAEPTSVWMPNAPVHSEAGGSAGSGGAGGAGGAGGGSPGSGGANGTAGSAGTYADRDSSPATESVVHVPNNFYRAAGQYKERMRSIKVNA